MKNQESNIQNNQNQASQQNGQQAGGQGSQNPTPMHQPAEKFAPSQDQMPQHSSDSELDQDIQDAQVDDSELEDEGSRPEDQIV